MKKLARYLLLLAAMGLGFVFATCKADDDDEPTYYTVTFDSDGGTEVKSQKVESGKKATKPETDPTKEATAAETYTFAGWYTSEDEGTTLSDTAFDFNTAITKDIILYAKWATNAAIYTVSFDTNGGTPVRIDSQSVIYGNKATKPADPTKRETAKEAFAFDNWYTSTDGGTTLSDTAFDFNTTIEGDITLYAKWKEADYIILKDCSKIRTMFETLCECYYDNSSYKYKFKKTITHFAKADEKPSSADYYLDAAENRIPLWYDEAATTLYYYLEPGKKMSLRTSYGQNSLFSSMEDATSIETKDFDTSNVTSMDLMFSGCSSLTSLDVSNFDTSKVTSMQTMFQDCMALTSLDVSKFDTSNVTNMYSMFFRCIALTSLDVSNFDTSKVTAMSYMFLQCSSLTSLDVSNFDTSNVTKMGSMFSGCSSLTALDVSNFDTSKVTNMSWMFSHCFSLTELDLSNFDTSKVTDMSLMFYNCPSLTTIFASDKFVTNGVTSDSDMFSSPKLQGGAGTVYDENHIDKEYARIDGGTENPGYFTAKTN